MIFYNSNGRQIMEEIIKHMLHHAVHHVAKEGAKSAGCGCVVTLLAMLTGIGSIFCILEATILN